MVNLYWPEVSAKKFGPVVTSFHAQNMSSLAQSESVTAAQLVSSSCSQIKELDPEMLVSINLESLAPHKNMFGNNLPSLGQTTTSSAYGITGLVISPPKN